MDFYAFYTGQCFDAYTWLGAHLEGERAVFRTFAPAAAGVVLLHGGRELPMERVHDGNFFEVWAEGVRPGDCYQYRIYRPDGGYTDHCNPYGYGMELRPGRCSVVRDLGEHTFEDGAWMASRTDRRQEPLHIYELHLGSWRRKPDGGWYRYDELAWPLIEYVKECGYNYVEFLPLSEHPCDESWGYQITGFYAPTSRYGTAKELMLLIDRLHQAGIGVILDFVPAHFAVDDYGLARYDGQALYEYPHRDVEVSEWGSHNFIHSRGEVRSFLQSCARYWLDVFHFDGLRMDAICAGCCYGVEAAEPWGIPFTHAIAAPNGVPLLPVQLYECAAELMIFLFLLWYAPRAASKGGILRAYMLAYAPVRFVLEFFRGDVVRGIYGPLSTSQWISLAVMAAAVVWLVRERRENRS